MSHCNRYPEIADKMVGMQSSATKGTINMTFYVTWKVSIVYNFFYLVNQKDVYTNTYMILYTHICVWVCVCVRERESDWDRERASKILLVGLSEGTKGCKRGKEMLKSEKY
jgi:hypothetical protein